MDNIITADDVIEYQACQGTEAAYSLLLLAGPDGYAGDYYEYRDLLNTLAEEASLIFG